MPEGFPRYNFLAEPLHEALSVHRTGKGTEPVAHTNYLL